MRHAPERTLLCSSQKGNNGSDKYKRSTINSWLLRFSSNPNVFIHFFLLWYLPSGQCKVQNKSFLSVSVLGYYICYSLSLKLSLSRLAIPVYLLPRLHLLPIKSMERPSRSSGKGKFDGRWVVIMT